MSGRSDQTFVFDEGPLSHFTQAGWLGLLELYVGEGRAWLPDTVHAELSRGVDSHPHLRQVLDAPWLSLRTVGDPENMTFGFYYGRLVDVPPTNVGECGVLALAEAHAAVAVIDDGTARKLAQIRGVTVKTSISILCDLINEGHLALSSAEHVADRLLRTEYRLPFKEGNFRQFVTERGLVDPYG
ncbi:hypothetical protein [Rathayibacter sp. VKM Ac-2857]|uniref:hypothetical protein n=1 Tax=Rathayibacter sp. VKM Ac-2857 TaxID=2739020 RepID=UPI00156708D4|nr:hypothetical protein [Rathayibacter sp. VKM Ac-2857]NQX18026.1 hypothetical protein [Rathayibacter sp. VKM Ac-2857]